MHILCWLGRHKAASIDPEKGMVVGGSKCGRAECGKILSNPIVWPDPPPEPVDFDENRVCPACHSKNMLTRWCTGLRPWVPHMEYKYRICYYGTKAHLHRECSCGFSWVEKTAYDKYERC